MESTLYQSDAVGSNQAVVRNNPFNQSVFEELMDQVVEQSRFGGGSSRPTNNL